MACVACARYSISSWARVVLSLTVVSRLRVSAGRIPSPNRTMRPSWLIIAGKCGAASVIIRLRFSLISTIFLIPPLAFCRHHSDIYLWKSASTVAVGPAKSSRVIGSFLVRYNFLVVTTNGTKKWFV